MKHFLKLKMIKMNWKHLYGKRRNYWFQAIHHFRKLIVAKVSSWSVEGSSCYIFFFRWLLFPERPRVDSMDKISVNFLLPILIDHYNYQWSNSRYTVSIIYNIIDLTLFNMQTHFETSAEDDFWKHCCKWRYCL